MKFIQSVKNAALGHKPTFFDTDQACGASSSWCKKKGSQVLEMRTVKGWEKWMWTASVIVLLYCDQLTNLCPCEKPRSYSETLTVECAVYRLQCDDNTRSQITTMCGDNPVKEIGGGQWDSWNTYHTTGTTQLTIYRQTNALIPANPIRALKSSGVSKTVFTQPQRGNTSYPIFKTRQRNRVKVESALITTQPCKHFD